MRSITLTDHPFQTNNGHPYVHLNVDGIAARALTREELFELERVIGDYRRAQETHHGR